MNLDYYQECERALKQIAGLDPAVDSEDGMNEWGEADCFQQAQIIARRVLATIKGVL